MKRIILLTIALVIMLVSIGGCWPWRHEDGSNGGRERHDDRRGGEPGVPGGVSGGGPGGHPGPGGAGGGH
jgi:hypothetical protein